MSAIVILTGGVAAGKTAVTKRFAALGVPIIDTDELAREAVTPGHQGLTQLVRLIDASILNNDGTLNRRRLREMIFADQKLRHQVEEILHPLIESLARERIAAQKEPYCIVAVPLLVETGLFNWGDRTLVVDVNERVQIERVMARDQIDEQQARAMLKVQATRSQRLAIADDVIDNSGTLDDLNQQVNQLHQEYLAMFTASSA